MPDVIDILPRGAFDPTGASGRLVLDHDLRLRRRFVFTDDHDVQVRLNEVRPVQLRDGDGLRLSDGAIILVEAAAEPLLEITAHDLAALVRIAWHLGNRHLPTQLLGDRLRIRDDHVIAEMVQGLGGRWRKLSAPFDPEGGAYAGGGAGHDGHAAGHHGHGRHDHA